MKPTEIGFSERYDDDSGVRIGVRLKGKTLAFAFPGMELEVAAALEDIDFFIDALTAIRDSQEPIPELAPFRLVPGTTVNDLQWDPEYIANKIREVERVCPDYTYVVDLYTQRTAGMSCGT